MFKFSRVILSFLILFSLPSLATRIPRTDWNTLAVIGDAGVVKPSTQALRDLLVKNNLKQLIVLGDNMYKSSDTYENVWDSWKKLGLEFTVLTIGNHNTGYAKEVKYFNLPAENYYKEIGGALFIVLNSDNKATAKSQIQWLDSVLSQSNYKMNFLVYHHPSVSLTDNHHWDERIEFQTGMRSIIKKYPSKITAIMNGHDHAAGFFMLDNTPLIVNGAAFEEKYFSNPTIKDYQFVVSKGWTSNGGLWWSKLDFNTTTNEAWIHYIRFDNLKQENCSIKIAPKPAFRAANCQ